ncbi:MAG: transglycosylase SLT domain-containing protein [Acidobacteriia bacterium]|nr:transglycosylase SLT domain-containing protein [Terriglobia bacterium]
MVAAIVLVAAGASLWWWTRPRRWDDSTHPPPPIERAIARYGAGKPREAEEDVRRFLRTYRAPAWEPRARVLAAWSLASRGRAAEIPSILPSPLDPGEPLAAHVDLLRARGLLAIGRWNDALAVAGRAAAVEGFPGREEALRCQAAALEGCGRDREAAAVLDRAGSPALRFEAARIALRHADRQGARRRLTAILLEASPGDDSERALDTLLTEFPDAGSRFLPAERSLALRAARRTRDAGRAQAALDLVEALRPKGAGPAALTADEALLEADLLVKLGRDPEAEAFVIRAARGDAESAAGARYLRAKLDLARGRGGAYRAGLEGLASAAGASRWRLQALADLARIEEGRPSETALRAYRRYRDVAGSAAEPSLLWREAWNAYDLGHADQADAGMRRVLDRRDAPDGIRAAALYWAGRREEQAGRSADSRSQYQEIVARWPNHYYGMLAARRLGVAPPRLADRPVPPSPDPTSPVSRRWLVAARSLRSIKLWEAASAAYRAAAGAAGPRSRSVALEAADAALSEGADGDAVQLVLLAVKDRDSANLAGLTLREARLVVPAQDPERLAGIARASGLDPALVAAVVLQESAFNPLALSSAGARGLLQLMPATGEEVARRIGLAGFRADRLFEPETNLRLGCAYFRDLLTRLGSLPVALAAYNAGASRAVRWTASGDDPDGERYVERIPIPDTRGYVKRILANVRLYRIAYSEGLGAR